MNVVEMESAECRRIRPLLDAYASHELAVETVADVEQHLRSCRRCADELTAIERTRAALRSAVRRDPVPRRAFELADPASVRHKRLYRARTYLLVAAVAAVLCGFAVSKHVTGAYPHQLALEQLEIYQLQKQVPEIFAAPIQDHIHCATYRTYPDEPPPASLTVRELGEDAPLRTVVARAAPEGFEVRLAHRCDAAGREFMHFALLREDQLMSVMATRRLESDSVPRNGAGAAEPGIFIDQAGDLEMAGFVAGGYLVFVLSDVDDQPARFASNLTAPMRRYLA